MRCSNVANTPSSLFGFTSTGLGMKTTGVCLSRHAGAARENARDTSSMPKVFFSLYLSRRRCSAMASYFAMRSMPKPSCPLSISASNFFSSDCFFCRDCACSSVCCGAGCGVATGGTVWIVPCGALIGGCEEREVVVEAWTVWMFVVLALMSVTAALCDSSHDSQSEKRKYF